MTKTILLGTIVAAILVTGIVSGATVFANGEDDEVEEGEFLIAESTLLDGLGAGALFPYIDTTPNEIVRAHVALTDATEDCGGGTAPTNITILAGVAGGPLEVVTLANTGIGSEAQCVFHATIIPGVGGIPSTVTDIVIATGASALTGINTITVSAEVGED